MAGLEHFLGTFPSVGISQSQYGEQFVLKGALMLLVWKTPAMRPTRDIDLLGQPSGES